MDKKNLILALALSMVVLLSWPLVMRYLAPPVPPEELMTPIEEPNQPTPQPKPAKPQASVVPPKSTGPAAPQVQTTQAAPREISIDTPYCRATLSNRGAVATSWILKTYEEAGTVRNIIGADGGQLQLIPQDIPERLTPPFGLRTPWSPEIAAQLNHVNFQIDGAHFLRRQICRGCNG
jgi:hypothetical protein